MITNVTLQICFQKKTCCIIQYNSIECMTVQKLSSFFDYGYDSFEFLSKIVYNSFQNLPCRLMRGLNGLKPQTSHFKNSSLTVNDLNKTLQLLNWLQIKSVCYALWLSQCQKSFGAHVILLMYSSELTKGSPVPVLFGAPRT